MRIPTWKLVPTCSVALGIAFSLPLFADQPSPATCVAPVTQAAPVPRLIPNSRTVFISNAGVDPLSLAAFEHVGDLNQPYNLFYTAMKKWGRFEIVDSPGSADLVLEIRFRAPLSDCGKYTRRQPTLTLTIIDTRTHFILWTIPTEVEGAIRQATWIRNLNTAIGVMVGSLKEIAGPLPARNGL